MPISRCAARRLLAHNVAPTATEPTMNDDDKQERLRQLQGLLSLVQAGVEQGSRRVEEMHLAIARRPFDALRPIPVVNDTAAVVEVLHDGITKGVHLAIRESAALLLGTGVRALDVLINERSRR
jgi:hypothetical protein